MTEADLMRAIQVAVSDAKLATLFRCNNGMGWVGELLSKRQAASGLIVTLGNARPLHAGLTEGSGDLIGWTPVHLDNHSLAVFTSLEVKRPKKRLTEVQENFRRVVCAAGGIAARVDSIESALAALSG